jgi:hypothetical protein
MNKDNSGWLQFLIVISVIHLIIALIGYLITGSVVADGDEVEFNPLYIVYFCVALFLYGFIVSISPTIFMFLASIAILFIISILIKVHVFLFIGGIFLTTTLLMFAYIFKSASDTTDTRINAFGYPYCMLGGARPLAPSPCSYCCFTQRIKCNFYELKREIRLNYECFFRKIWQH